MKDFFNSRRGVGFAATVWTVMAASWLALCVRRFSDGTSEGLIVLTAITAVLGVVNSVLQWIRYVNFEKETKE